MSSRLEMLQVTRLAHRHLGSAADAVRAWFSEQIGPEGGGLDRAGNPDLYYTVFALEGLIALQAELPSDRVKPWLDGFGTGDELDLVHLSCLARCRADIEDRNVERDLAVSERIAVFRAEDGAFANMPDRDRGSVYHSFLALGAYEDLGMTQDIGTDLRDAVTSTILDILESRRAADGGYANVPGSAKGSTPVTAAAVTVMRAVEAPIPDGVEGWLLSRLHPEGGFVAGPDTPVPDTLSTAVTLHALSILKTDLDPLRNACLDFLDTLWTGTGFCGHWADDIVDVEYTWYALLALGHLT